MGSCGAPCPRTSPTGRGRLGRSWCWWLLASRTPSKEWVGVGHGRVCTGLRCLSSFIKNLYVVYQSWSPWCLFLKSQSIFLYMNEWSQQLWFGHEEVWLGCQGLLRFAGEGGGSTGSADSRTPSHRSDIAGWRPQGTKALSGIKHLQGRTHRVEDCWTCV